MSKISASSGGWGTVSENTLSEKFPLHRACRDGDADFLRSLLRQEAARSHIAVEDTYYGWTPSHWAAYFGKLECLRLLICGMGNGIAANPGQKTSRFSQTPIHIAAFAGHPHCLQWLIQAGADPNAQDYLGETSLHKAARTGSVECVNLLAMNKAALGIRNNNGQTAVQLASACGFTDLASHLQQLEGKQDGMAGASGITRSIPAHGLNGGVFPPCSNSALFTNTLLSQSTNGQEAPVKNGHVQSNGHILPNGFHSSTTVANSNGQLPSVNNQSNGGVCTSSNGYYGFQSTSAEANGGSEECEMETDASPVSIGQNGSTNEHKIGVETGFVNGQGRTPNGQTDKITLEFTNGDVIGTVLGFTNGHSVGNASRMASGVNGTCSNGLDGNTLKSHINLGQDITLNHGISQNHIPVAGCKRSREEGFIPEIKRMKTEDNTIGAAPFSKETPESTVVDGAQNGTQNTMMETAQSFPSSALEQTSSPSAQPHAPKNSVSKAQVQQQWIWVV
ncbi:ankyrin repeat domain-containing protein 10-like isoform X4 [Penaeus japonicus]|uniref:ankyrin repeat domain-containing protein 10-like isoform X4 n=1 Tax=Penaeus japonicus TaxID=27405 RepID=UPI001C715132|nr:ankyrin repeat domain-containing protein 10-like isoform X4 [Penaeus japonicus]XP_042857754.1 ankyrin repeat domain-containing protein 10-like isoform X4 [Penaeus japonicus]XP_042857763.1 ankyrin repeat domain-containing protein 10-like isoform X4 [Penaeus japonicus]